MKVLLKCEYNFDGNKYWLNSQVKNEILTIKDNKDFETIKTYIEENDYIKFTKVKPQIMYEDSENGEPKQVGLVYRIVVEDYEDGKKYRGDLWLSIKEVKDFNF